MLRLIDWVFAVFLAFALAQPLWLPLVSSWHPVSAMTDCGVITGPIKVHTLRGL